MIPRDPSKLETYCEAWRSSLATLLSRMSSDSWQTDFVEAQSAAAPLVWARVAVQSGITGEMSLSFGSEDIATLLQLLLGEPTSVSAALDEMQAEAAGELVRQWCGLAASALKPEFGELRLPVDIESAVAAAGPAKRWIRALCGERSIVVGMALDEPLATSLQGPPFAVAPGASPIAAAPAAASASSAAPAPVQSRSTQVEELLRQGNLELLMDVELAVALRFGCRQATLHEVLDLSTGAVLELDREIKEPVDLLLNGRVIARGEVVVVDGNYGLRVMEVASAQQRVSSL